MRIEATVKLAPSILAADFVALGEQVAVFGEGTGVGVAMDRLRTAVRSSGSVSSEQRWQNEWLIK